jgi:hypothetical protein
MFIPVNPLPINPFRNFDHLKRNNSPMGKDKHHKSNSKKTNSRYGYLPPTARPLPPPAGQSPFPGAAATAVAPQLPLRYPIVWTDVLTPYGTADAGDAPLAVFGALSFWWMGEHGTPRMGTSDQVWFMNDQLAIRFIEEIDFDYAADDATAVLLTHAAA